MRIAASAASFGILLAGCHADTVPPEQLQRQGREVVALFEQSCAANGGDGAKVTAWAEPRQAQKLAADEVNKLPPGMMESGVQAVWRIQKDGADYYLGLSPDSCSVKTAKADENTVRQQFEELVKRGAQGANVELRADNAAQSPFPIRQLSYAWRPAGSGSETVLTANTSTSDRLPVQAALMLTHQVYHSAPILEQD